MCNEGHIKILPPCFCDGERGSRTFSWNIVLFLFFYTRGLVCKWASRHTSYYFHSHELNLKSLKGEEHLNSTMVGPLNLLELAVYAYVLLMEQYSVFVSICMCTHRAMPLCVVGGLHWHEMEKKKRCRDERERVWVSLKSWVHGTNSCTPTFLSFLRTRRTMGSQR